NETKLGFGWVSGRCVSRVVRPGSRRVRRAGGGVLPSSSLPRGCLRGPCEPLPSCLWRGSSRRLRGGRGGGWLPLVTDAERGGLLPPRLQWGHLTVKVAVGETADAQRYGAR